MPRPCDQAPQPAPDLENSLSPVYARVQLGLGQKAWAVIGASADPDSAACDQILTFALIWFDYLRRRQQRRVLRGRKVFLERSRTRVIGKGLAFRNRVSFRFDLYEFDAAGHVRAIGPLDHGNLMIELNPCLPVPVSAEPVAAWVQQLTALPGVEALSRAHGLLSLRVRCIEFATTGRGVNTSVLDRQSPVGPESFDPVMMLARELAPTIAQRRRRDPKSWLEAQVRYHLASSTARRCQSTSTVMFQPSPGRTGT